jgi:hypothetical protein
MPNVWRLTLEMEQLTESGIDFVLKSSQVIFANDENLREGLSIAIKKAAEDALFDITGKHIRAKRARTEERESQV